MERLEIRAVRDALEDFRKIRQVAGDNVEFRRNFRARVRDAPSALSIHFLPTLTYYYSQAGGKYEEICDVIEKESEREFTCGALEFGYGALLYLILKHLHLSSDPRGPIKCFEEIVKSPPLRLVLMKRRLLPYLLELKKLAEAEFEAGGE
jgi:CRISPR type III-B/RAMP module-associated protein Cmr5